MPTPNTYSFTKSDFATMLQHIVDLIPEWMFLYDPAEDLVVYHNQKTGLLFKENSPPVAPVSLHHLLEETLVPEDWPVLERNALELMALKERDIHEVRFRVRTGDVPPGYRWCCFRQKLFWQDEGSGVKLILCITTEVKGEDYSLYFADGIQYS
jgi:PAS domain-containing protein